MTVNLSIKGVPEQLAERLRRRAEQNHRSLQGELMAIITAAAAEPMAEAAGRPARGVGEGTRYGSLTTEEVYAEIRRRFPEPDTTSPRGVDIIRADRDARSR